MAYVFDPLKCVTGKCVKSELARGTDAPLHVAMFLVWLEPPGFLDVRVVMKDLSLWPFECDPVLWIPSGSPWAYKDPRLIPVLFSKCLCAHISRPQIGVTSCSPNLIPFGKLVGKGFRHEPWFSLLSLVKGLKQGNVPQIHLSSFVKYKWYLSLLVVRCCEDWLWLMPMEVVINKVYPSHLALKTVVIHSCNKYLSSTYHITGMVIGQGWIQWTKWAKIPALMELAF